MSARSRLVGKKSSRPSLGPSEAIFSMDRKNVKNSKKMHIFLGGPMVRAKYVCLGVPKRGPWLIFFQKSEISKISRSVHSGWAHIKLNGLESCRVERCDMPIDFFMGWMARSGQNWHFFGPPQPVHGGPLLLGGGGGVWKSGDLEIQMVWPKQKLSFSDT